jgi:hypothetical protein
MEVDRISGMGGTGPEASPAWQKSALRRRKFFEEVAPPTESEADSADESPAQDDSAEAAPEASATYPAPGSDSDTQNDATSPAPSFRAVA